MSLDGPHNEGGTRPGSNPDEWIHASYSRILTSCVCAGLPPPDAEDIAQDIWVWLLRQGTPALALSMPWLSAVARNFILRYRRKSYRHCLREGRSLDDGSDPRSSREEADLEINELFEKTAALLPDVERRLLRLIRDGYTLAESARILKMPRGSRAYHHAQVIARARRELKPSLTIARHVTD
jgi:DNA-directed RNA polymerase specialized sigma24 family protein